MRSKPPSAPEPLKQLADALRAKNAVDYSQAKLEMHGEAVWVEYCRVKDLLKHLRENPDLMEGLVKPTGPGREVEEQARDAVLLLLKKKLLLPCDRKFKKPKPGKKKLVKWPKTLETTSEMDLSGELFLAWSYERPTTMLFYLGAAAVVVVVLLVCLFPLAPARVRLAVLYFLIALLSALLGTVVVRYIIWLVVWLTTGNSLWLLPNLTSDDLPITEIFSPWITFDRPEEGKNTLLPRLLVVLLMGGACYGLYRTGPDPETLKASVKEAHDSVLGYFDLMGARAGIMDKGTNNGTTWGATQTEEDAAQQGQQSEGAREGRGDKEGDGGAEAGGKPQEQATEREREEL